MLPYEVLKCGEEESEFERVESEFDRVVKADWAVARCE